MGIIPLLPIVSDVASLALSCATDPCSDIDPLGVSASSSDQASIPEVTYDSCNANVATLCSAQSMYNGANNSYAREEQDRYEFLDDTLLCPWTLEPYKVVFGDADSFGFPVSRIPDPSRVADPTKAEAGRAIHRKRADRTCVR